MLHAFVGGKKRGSGVEGESLSGNFGGAEDTLTATVFECLSYLPDRMLCEILFSKDIWREKVEVPREIVAIRYWPRWELRDSQTEPDCVIEFDDRVLIAEAKRYDFANRQSPTQLANEWLAGCVKYALTDKKLWLLAVSACPIAGRKP